MCVSIMSWYQQVWRPVNASDDRVGILQQHHALSIKTGYHTIQWCRNCENRSIFDKVITAYEMSYDFMDHGQYIKRVSQILTFMD